MEVVGGGGGWEVVRPMKKLPTDRTRGRETYRESTLRTHVRSILECLLPRGVL